jgi:hypothetical protein
VTSSTESGEDKGQRLDREELAAAAASKNKFVEIMLALLLAAANAIGQRLVSGSRLGT